MPSAVPTPVGVDPIASHARTVPNRLALVEAASGRRWTYAELDLALSQRATELAIRGVRMGDRVASLARNSAEHAMLHFACERAGAIHVPLSWRLCRSELQAILGDAAPRLVLGDASLAELGVTGEDLAEFGHRSRLRTPSAAAPMDLRRPVVILYTSGTQGRAKGVVLDGVNLAATTANTIDLCEVTASSVYLADAPMFHIIGLVLNFRPVLAKGGSVVVSEGFQAARTLSRLGDAALGMTHYFCVPQMAGALREDPAFDPALMRNLVAMFTGGAPHPAGKIRQWLADGIRVADGYGMTEIGTFFGMPVDAGVIDRLAGSVGRVATGMTYRIVDRSGRDCAVGETGDLIVRGASVTRGYWGSAQMTKEAFTEDGWFITGDLVCRDAKGFHWVMGRSKDMIISGGENIFPAEVELAAGGLPGVRECALVGVPDERWGEAGHLFVVPHAVGTIDRGGMAEALGERIARYKIPKRVTFVDELPKTGSGKIRRNILREWALQEAAGEGIERTLSAGPAR